MADPDAARFSRRDLLKLAGGAGVVGAGGFAGARFLDGGEDAPTEGVDDERARELAERFAPTLYFDEAEPWFPTDPRPYVSDDGDRTVVDGFDALDGYTRRFESDGAPPAPTAFYSAVRYEESPLAVVQFWFYSVFDQFTTNFHWHDWEVVHVFVDVEADEPVLFVASAHSRNVPNNEFLDPEPDAIPRVLPELGSHSSGLSVNANRDSFQRFSLDGTFPDVTNRALEGVEAVGEWPLAYGLPRDEGSRLPFVVPELDGAPLYEHERLPSVDRSDLIPSDLTVRSYGDLASPPDDLPRRETGVVFGSERESTADVTYALEPAADLEHVDAFEGPQLSFEFDVPEFAEDRIAGHITATGVPWEQPRYENPAADISDPSHRSALAERYDAVAPPDSVGRVVAAVSRLAESADAPDGEGLITTDLGVESVVLLESEPTAVPTFGGVAVAQDVPPGEHRLTVNGAGVAPHSERVSVSGDAAPTVAGVDGEIPLAPREDAVKLRVDPDGTDDDLEALAVEDDFAGRLYDAPLSDPDAVYVHRGGAYTTEVRDADGEVGAFRVNPDPDGDGGDGNEGAVATVDRPRTGKASLAEYLASVATETAARVRAEADGDGGDDDGDGGDGSNVRGLARALEAVGDAAARAAERADAGDENGADDRLEAVRDRLDRAAERLSDAADDVPDPVANAVDRRVAQARRRNEQAMDAGKL
ncbi:hypothetical protein G9464_04845 [Halostella sp. JP-L12]|uniref:hypothetical protein n=1 Tax=Halostella TaxID=1843185 RepID=UPI000EF7A9A1|nr:MULTISPECIES: hypothetical protein [Halostella]NHN46924.1 hypothetical protein [Halostella sp. JP-L12]